MSQAFRQYVESTPATIEGDKRTIYRAIQYYHAIGERPSARDLEQLTTINHSTVRDAIIELREDHQVPIANLGNGYFIVDDPEDLERVVEHYQGVIETKRQRLQAITRAFNSRRYD